LAPAGSGIWRGPALSAGILLGADGFCRRRRRSQNRQRRTSLVVGGWHGAVKRIALTADVVAGLAEREGPAALVAAMKPIMA